MTNENIRAILLALIMITSVFAFATPTAAQTSGEVEVTLEPTDGQASPGDVQEYDVVVDAPDNGISAYDVTVNIDDTAIGQIAGVEETRTSGSGSSNVASDNSSVSFNRALFANSFDAANSITIATVSVEAVDSDGESATVSVDSETQVSDNNNNQYSVIGFGDASFSVQAGGLAVQDASLPAIGEQGELVEGSATINNTGDSEVTQDVQFEVVDGTVVEQLDSQSLTLASGETQDVDLSGVIPDDLAAGDFVIQIATDDDSAEQAFEVARPEDSGVISGNVRDVQGNQIEDVSDFTIEFIDSNTGVVEEQRQPDDNGEFTQQVPVGPGGTEYTVRVDEPGNQDRFTDFTRDVELRPQATERVDVRLERDVTPDRIDISKDPESGVADLDGTITDTVNVETEDNPPTGELGPIEGTPVAIEITGSNTNEINGVSDADLEFAPSARESTDANGTIEFELSLSESVNLNQIETDVEFELEFDAVEGDDVTATQNITFQAEVRGPGTLSGQVDEVDQNIDLGVENVEPVTGLGVHAVPLDDVQSNTVTVNNVNENDRYRVVEFDEGVVSTTFDARSDYLATTSGAAEIVQNETTLGFDVDQGGSVSLHFLTPSNYTVQEFDETDDQFENVSVQRPNGAVFSGNFNAEEDLRYDAIADRFGEDPAVLNDTTNELGNFELLNLPEQQYVVVAGELSGPAPATDSDFRYGYADFAGFDIVDVTADTDSSSEQRNVDLSVQQFEVDRIFDFDLEVVVENEAGDLVKTDRIQTGQEREVIINVTATDQDTGNAVPDAAQGQEIDLSLLGETTAGELSDTSPNVTESFDDGQPFASVTFQADSLDAGTVNISAATENTNAQVFNTSAGGQGLNNQSDQAEIEVFKTVEITGDVVNGEDENIPGANVTLINLDTGEDVANTSTGETGSYVFTDIETGFNYSAEAVALDSNGDEVSNERELNGGDPVETALGGEDIVVADADPNNPLNPPAGTGSPVDGISNEQFNAVLTNGADTTLVELRGSVGEWSSDPFGEINNVELTLSELRDVVDYWAAQQ